jgi:hypothetical protein
MSRILSTVASASELVYRSSQALPTAPDGLTDNEAAAITETREQKQGFLNDFIESIRGQIQRGVPVSPNPETLVSQSQAIGLA